MAFQVTKSGDVLVIDVEGQLIVGNRQELKQKVLEELEGGERKFVVDFMWSRPLPSGRKRTRSPWRRIRIGGNSTDVPSSRTPSSGPSDRSWAPANTMRSPAGDQTGFSA